MIKKYEFTGEIRGFEGHMLHRIRRISDGLIGGWIESEDNLCQAGSCFVYNEAKVFGNASILGDAQINNEALVYDNATIAGHVRIYGSVWVYEDALINGFAKLSGNVMVFGHAHIVGHAEIFGNTQIFDNAKIFGDANIGNTGTPFCIKIYGDTKIYGESIIRDNVTVKDKAHITDRVRVINKCVVDDYIELTGDKTYYDDKMIKREKCIGFGDLDF